MTDNGLAALAAALEKAKEQLWLEPVDDYRNYAAAVRAALPAGWRRDDPPEGTRLILAATDLITTFGTRTDDGRVLIAEWGEPDASGCYTPTFTASGPAVITEQAATIATLRAVLDGLVTVLDDEQIEWGKHPALDAAHEKARAALAKAKEAGG
jgi:hypothetical protein